MRNVRWLVIPALLLSGCGGGKSRPKEPEPIIEEKPKPKPPPPPPPVCVRAGDTMSLIGMVEADAETAKFCVSDGAESNLCYAVDIAEGGTKKYSELAEAPKGSPAVLDPEPARVETTNTEVKICKGEDCKSFKPKVGKLSNEIDAVINASGTYAAILLGNAEKGKGTVDVYSAAKPKKATASIKYAKGNGDYKCGEARMLGDTVFISASVCAGPTARGWLYTVKGKKIANVGGKDFGTYGTVPIQVTDTQWAFLEETARTVVIQDVVTGKIERTIDVWTPMAGEADGLDGGDEAPAEEEAAPAEDMAAPPASNPGESAMVRGAENTLVVVSGGPMPGSVAVIGTVHGIVTTINSLVCEPSAPPPEEEESADTAEGGEDELSADSDEGGE